MEIKDFWTCITNMRKPYQPKRCYLKNKDGQHVPQHKQAHAMADYLATRQWAPHHIESAQITTEHIKIPQHNNTNYK